MPTASKELRASPITIDRPSASPIFEDMSEDERQFMMLRHSDDDEGDSSGNSNGSGNGNNNNGGGEGNNNESNGGGGGHHVIPKSPDRALTAKGSGPRSVSMRGRRDSRGGSGAIMGPPPSVVARQVTHQQQYQQQQQHPQYQYQPQPPVPFRVGGPPPPRYGAGPPQYMPRGVSEDPASLAQSGYPPVYQQQQQHHQQQQQPQYNNNNSNNDHHPQAPSLNVAPSWGSIDVRQGTFDYGDSNGFEPGAGPPGAEHYGHGPPAPGAKVITPAQTIRKTTAAQSQYMYPPSSPIKTGPSPKASPQGSPRVEDSPEMTSSKHHNNNNNNNHSEESNSSEEELAAEWLPPKGNSVNAGRQRNVNERVVEAKAVHIPPPPPNGTVARPQFLRHVSQAPKSTTKTGGATTTSVHGTAATTNMGGPNAATPQRYVPPLVVDPSRSADSAESPGHSLRGGRVQLVGGGIGETSANGAPWSLVSNSRSMEESNSSVGGSGINMGMGMGSASNEWDPPRPDRRPMVPPPGRPVGGTPARGPGGSAGYPPPEYHRGPPPPQSPHHPYPGYDPYGQQAVGAPPPPPTPSHGQPLSIQHSSSSHSSHSSSGGVHNRTGYPPSPFAPERPLPPSPLGYPGSPPGYPPTVGGAGVGYAYPGYPPYHPSQYPHHPAQQQHQPPSQYPPQYSPSSSYPPNASRPGPQEEEEEADPVHPLLKDYNPHRDGIRPQFTNVKTKKETAAAKRGREQMMMQSGHGGAPVGPDGRLLLGPDGRPLGPLGSPNGAANTPRRRRRRNPSEKAAAAAAMAAAAAAAMKERNEKLAKKKKLNEEDVVTAADGGATNASGEHGAGHHSGTATSPFSEEELKTLGSGDDEDIPAAKRAAMASAVALRAAAGGSPLEPPKYAAEVEFDIADPPLTPVCPPSASDVAVLESATLMTENDVLCGRGGGTNSQMGNRRFRALVRDFQPTYLMVKRREKPRMARSVVLIVRNRGGRFLRRDESDGRLYEVGDEKAEAKTSQALREGLDVRATKTAANTLLGTSGEGGGGNKKRKTSPNAALENNGVIAKSGGGGKMMPKERPAKPLPVHAPDYNRPGRPAPPPGSAHPGQPAGYYPYPPRYDDPYYRGGRYPPGAAPPGYDYGPNSHPGPSQHPGTHHPAHPSAAHPSTTTHHHYHHYGGGGQQQQQPPPQPGYPHYPPSYGGAYPGYGPPSPTRSSPGTRAPTVGHSASFCPMGPPGAPPNLTPIVSRPKTLNI